jgi:hypothetical protein
VPRKAIAIANVQSLVILLLAAICHFLAARNKLI